MQQSLLFYFFPFKMCFVSSRFLHTVTEIQIFFAFCCKMSMTHHKLLSNTHLAWSRWHHGVDVLCFKGRFRIDSLTLIDSTVYLWRRKLIKFCYFLHKKMVDRIWNYFLSLDMKVPYHPIFLIAAMVFTLFHSCFYYRQLNGNYLNDCYSFVCDKTK